MSVFDLGHAAGIMQQLEQAEADMRARPEEYAIAAGDVKRLTRDWDLVLAKELVKAAGGSADIRKANALIAASSHGELYAQLADAEASFEALKVVMHTLDKRAMAMQSLLKAETQQR